MFISCGGISLTPIILDRCCFFGFPILLDIIFEKDFLLLFFCYHARTSPYLVNCMMDPSTLEMLVLLRFNRDLWILYYQLDHQDLHWNLQKGQRQIHECWQFYLWWLRHSRGHNRLFFQTGKNIYCVCILNILYIISISIHWLKLI